MRFYEFDTVSDIAADAYKKKQLDKAREKKERELVRRNGKQTNDEKIRNDVITGINTLLNNSDNKAVTVTPVKTKSV